MQRLMYKLAVVLWLSPCLLLADTDPRDLEARLETAVGRERLELLVELTALNRDQEPRQAVASGGEALELLRSVPDDELELSVLNDLAGAYVRLARNEEALLHGSRAERLARKRGDKPALARALSQLGKVHRYQNDYDRAREYLLRAISLYEDLGDGAGLGEATRDLGITYRLTSDFPTALKHYYTALEAFERAGDRSGVAQVLNSLGIVYTKIGRYDEAQQHLLRSLVIQEDLGDERSIAMVLNNLGFAYLKLNEPAKALDQYHRAMEIKERLGDRRGMAFSFNGMGHSYFQIGEPDRAMEYYDKSLELKQEIGDRKGMATVMLEKSMVHMGQKDYDRAIELLDRSLVIAKAVGSRETAKDIYEDLSNSYAATGRHEEALAAYQRYKEIEDEIFNEENSKIMAEMQARYESEQRSREIDNLRQQQAIDALEMTRQRSASRTLIGGLALLLLILLLLLNGYRLRAQATRERVRKEERERYIAELEVRKAEVEARNAEMERFTYTVSHDLRSPLVTIRGFLGLLKKDTEQGKTDQMAKDMASIDAAAEQMSRLLDELLELSRVGRQMNTPQYVALTELAREVTELLAIPIRDRGVEVDIAPDLPTVFGDRPRLKEVLQNLVENGVKFVGDQAQPRIEIGCRQDEEETVVFVRDNGMGIEPRYQEKVFGLFDRLSPEVEGTGVGLALVKRIVEIHGGRVWVESDGAGSGSTFCFTIPPAP